MKRAMLGMALLWCLPWSAWAALDSETRCFSADNGGKPVHLQFTVVGDADAGWQAAYVRYGKRGRPITLAWLRGEHEILAEDRPWQFTDEWLEIVDGKVHGRYTTVHQGARYYGFHYRGVGGREVEFAEDLAALDASGRRCAW